MTENATFDYVVVGGGTAGAIVAARLSEDPDVSVCLFEAGPSDVGFDDVLQLRRWLSLLEGPIDLAYTTTLQPRGNAHIVHSRAAVLGGCSSHNTQIYFKPFPGDWQDWVDRGAEGWEPEVMGPYYDKLLTKHQIVAEKDRNPVLKDWIPAAAEAAGVQANPDWNAGPFRDGVGFLDVGYDPETGVRSSSSVAYLHPIMGKRPNLTVRTDTWVRRVNLSGGRAVSVSTDSGDAVATREIVVCGGSIDTPRLLLLSGIGPADDLRALDIEVQHDLPGVGENLIDHPESIIIWELSRPLPPQGVMDADCALFVNRLGNDDRPDLMYHTYQLPFTFNTERLGYPVPDDVICMTPNIPRSRSVGRMWLLSKHHEVKPALDFQYFTDPEGVRRADDRGRAQDRARGGGDRAVQELGQARGGAGAEDHERRRPVHLRAGRAPHGLPPERHLQDGRRVRRPGRGRSAVAGAGRRGAEHRRRVDLPEHADGQSDGGHVHDRRALGGSRARAHQLATSPRSPRPPSPCRPPASAGWPSAPCPRRSGRR